jgi:hypothetical protein
MDESGITSAGKPFLVRMAEALTAKKVKQDLVRVKHQTTCFLLLIANLAAELRHVWL